MGWGQVCMTWALCRCVRVEGPAWLGPSTRLYAPEAHTVGVMFACLHCRSGSGRVRRGQGEGAGPPCHQCGPQRGASS